MSRFFFILLLLSKVLPARDALPVPYRRSYKSPLIDKTLLAIQIKDYKMIESFEIYGSKSIKLDIKVQM